MAIPSWRRKEIYGDYLTGKFSQRELAIKYNVSITSVRNILKEEKALNQTINLINMSENKYPIGGYAPGETKYGKCPECNAPCEVTTKHSVLNEDGDSIEIPYDEYNYKPAGAVWVKGAPVNETNDLMQFAADYHSIFDDHIHRVLLFVWKPEGMDRIIYEVIGKGIHDFVNVENIVQYLDESGTASNKDAIEFAEWAGWEWRRVEGKSLWENQKTLEVIKTNVLYERYQRECGAAGKA